MNEIGRNILLEVTGLQLGFIQRGIEPNAVYLGRFEKRAMKHLYETGFFKNQNVDFENVTYKGMKIVYVAIDSYIGVGIEKGKAGESK